MWLVRFLSQPLELLSDNIPHSTFDPKKWGNSVKTKRKKIKNTLLNEDEDAHVEIPYFAKKQKLKWTHLYHLLLPLLSS